MADEKWIDTKKEFEIDALTGEPKLTKVTKELDSFRRKDWWDVALKLLPLITIIATLVVFYFQQRNENERQKRIYALDVYTKTTTDIQIILTKPVKSSEAKSAHDELQLVLYPKIKFLNDKQILNETAIILNALICYLAMGDFIETKYTLTNEFQTETSKSKNDSIVGISQNDFNTFFHILKEGTETGNLQLDDSLQRKLIHTSKKIDSLYSNTFDEPDSSTTGWTMYGDKKPFDDIDSLFSDLNDNLKKMNSKLDSMMIKNVN